MADIGPQMALSLREDSAGSTEFKPQQLHIQRSANSSTICPAGTPRPRRCALLPGAVA